MSSTSKSGAPTAHPSTDQELLAAAATTMRWLQDRGKHVPPEQLDPREGRVLRQLRTAKVPRGPGSLCNNSNFLWYDGDCGRWS